jgi:GTP-binding protein HflX
VGLVGYTNAGKSSLFNALTSGGAFAHDKLFATLSTRVEQWSLTDGNSVLLSDTVGFIRDLPHHLVASFRSTLEETVQCQLLLVVVDVADSVAHQQFETVLQTLDDIGAVSQPRQLILNKIDCLGHADQMLLWLRDHPDALPISAKTGEGLDRLAEIVRGHAIGPELELDVTIATADAKAVMFLERRTPVQDRDYGDGHVTMRTTLGARQAQQLLSVAQGVRIGETPLADLMDNLWPLVTAAGDTCRIAATTRWSAP